MRTLKSAACAVALLAILPGSALAAKPGLWRVYDNTLSKARYIDLTHDISPNMPVWKGFGPATFKPAVDPTTQTAYTYAKDGFEATAYEIATDQFGTQLDPPAHWAPEYPGIDELPAHLRGAAAGRHLDRAAGQEGPEVRAAGVGHPQVRAAAREDPARLGGDGALRLVEEVDGRGRARQGAGRRPELPRRRRSTR